MSAQSTPANVAATISELQALIGDRLSTALPVREQHGDDLSHHAMQAPDAVAFAQSTEEVAEIVLICARHKTPIIAYGTGTSLEGHIAAVHGGICVDVSHMNEILRVGQEDMDVTVQPGVTRKQLNEHLRDMGLFFPVDPGADASLGGMTATRASGTNAVRYGTMRENVLSVTVVMADGRIVRTARRARKSSAGYDLTRLMIGSEGTLGIITEVTLKLYGIPEAISAAVCSFDTLEGAVDTVIQTIQIGIPIARIELLDDVQMDAINRYSGLDYPVKSTLFLEFHGTGDSVRDQAETVQELSSENGGGDFQFAVSTEDRSKLWQARHDAAHSCSTLKPGCALWATDVCVPISRLAECIHETKKDLETASMPAPLVGHVGDGNFHLCFLIDPNKPEELAEAQVLNGRLIERALAMDGTCTGEHGVGLGKMAYMEREHGEGVAVMRAIKQTLDPDNIMNPGKIIQMN